ncbi:MAG: hypothetical protein IPG00_11975 [Saprospiraceae bacterium]|nr:hypothetical protein [Saprospiraceae bacterium]
MDKPRLFTLANIEATDQFARQFGIYAKGQLGKLDYRIALNKPFVNGTAPSAVAKNVGAEDSGLTDNGSCFQIGFWDKESNVLPFYVGYFRHKSLIRGRLESRRNFPI